MLNKATQLKLTDLLQDQFSDLDIYREKPFVYDNKEGLYLIVKPVAFNEHDIFLRQMSELIIKHYEIFSKVDFLNHQDFRDKNAVDELVGKFNIFEANRSYTRFKKQATKFMLRWAYVTKKAIYIKLEHNKRLCKKILKTMEPSDFVYILFLLFTYNFNLVKKNLLELIKMFNPDIATELNTQTDTLCPGTSRKAVVMPKYSTSPFSASILTLLETQSCLR
jgi:hypothetical protein